MENENVNTNVKEKRARRGKPSPEFNELQEMANNFPVLMIAEFYGVSAPTVSKWFKSNSITSKGRGYWKGARLEDAKARFETLKNNSTNANTATANV